jgi:hypothetical protein
VSGDMYEYFRDNVRNRHSGRQLDQWVVRLDGVRRFLPRSCLPTASSCSRVDPGNWSNVILIVRTMRLSARTP